MIRFGLRLALRGGKEAAVRLVVTASAVALGVGLLLVTLAAINGVNAQNSRYAWLNSGIPEATAADAKPSPDPLWGTLGTDFYDGKTITRVDVAATGPRSPIPPGIPRLPNAGEYYASPALTALLRSAPTAELSSRYPGNQVGTIGRAALPAPNSLIIVVGRTAAELSHVPGAAQVATIATKSPGSCIHCRYGTNVDGIDLILSVASGALLLPVLIFIGTATRMSAARREQRFAAMRLVGATPRQVSVVSAVESTVAAIAGTAGGFGAFLLLRLPLAAVPFTGEPFYPSDLSLHMLQVTLVVVGVPLGAAAAAQLAVRRVRISPLGVSRRVTPRPPRAYRLIPLIIGLGELMYFVGRRPDTTPGQVRAYLSGLFVTMLGLVVAGPWLTMVGARVMARRTNRPATLIAARRLADNPQAGFRAVSGLVLALFVTSAAAGVMTTMSAERGVQTDDVAARRTLLIDFSRGRPEPGAPESFVDVPDAVLSSLRSIGGVTATAVIHTNPLGTEVAVGQGRQQWRMVAGLVSCDELAGVAGFGRCAPSASVALVPPNLSYADPSAAAREATVWPAAAISSAQLRRLPAQGVAVSTDGSRAAIEQARTALTAAFPDYQSPATVAESNSGLSSAKQLAGYQQLTDVVIVVTLCIAGCSLAASVVGGLNDRKRPFSLLRLTGVPLSMLRRVVAFESAVPLLAAAVVAITTGFLGAHLFLKSQMHYSLRPPAPGYYMAVLAGLIASLGVIGSALPLLERVTGPATARNE